MYKIFLSVLLGAVLLFSAIACSSIPGVQSARSALAQPLTEDVLVNNNFRIYSSVFSDSADKHYVKFLSDGSIECNECHANAWRIKDDKTLEFMSGERVMNTFVYNASADALVRESGTGVGYDVKIWIER